MAVEIERKFLVLELGSLRLEDGLAIDQGYLSEGEPTVRVRTMGPKAFLTIKSAPGQDDKKEGPIINSEYEYEIPMQDARELLEIAACRLQKTRYVMADGLEVDVFHGRHAGLVMAEFESEDGSYPAVPPGVVWKEVTNDKRYKNSWMARHGLPGNER